MIPNSKPTPDAVRAFRASRLWTSNVWGAVLAGLGAGAVQVAIASMLLVDTKNPHVRLLGAGWLLILALAALLLWPGHGIARYPYEVVVLRGTGIRLRAPLKVLEIPSTDLRAMDRLWSGGRRVQLRRRHGLLGAFVVSAMFGREAGPLAAAIQDEIKRCSSWLCGSCPPGRAAA